MFPDRKGYNVVGANVKRKYGDAWQEVFSDLSHRRLRSWGLNTIGGWSHRFVTSQRRTPYTVVIRYRAPEMSGIVEWSAPRREIDVFHPGFEKALREALRTQAPESIDDPWCIGFFVDNERKWTDRTAFGIGALRSRADEPAKQRLVAFLQARYAEIDGLNREWGARYESWQDLLDSRLDEESYRRRRQEMRTDLIAFGALCYDAYFMTIREVLRDVAPNQLYLGCRFSNYNPDVVEAAAKHCDVVSYNVYWARTMTDFLHGGSWPGGGNLNPNRWQRPGPDVPLLIGEFSFGTTDRGMFRGRLLNGYSENQKARADDYRTYMTSALRDPRIVGAHWFQFVDQPLTGREDGEGTQFGLLDVCDTPYWHLIQNGLRPVGDRLYEERDHARAE